MPIKPTITYYTPRIVSSGTALSSVHLDAQTNMPTGTIILYDISIGTIIITKTVINAYLLPPYHNSNFLDVPTYVNVDLNII